ncbi:MAG TPA: hypothetical protein PKC43_13555 [Phycisphaerales bacterium]|nr:hypothetical protein [Phycisphaerales bacterium]HMP38458.1 hypothetical protein [Phycisphaerales bacterium]
MNTRISASSLVRPLRRALPAFALPAALFAASISGTGAAHVEQPPRGNGGGWTGTTLPMSAVLARLFQSMRALAIVDQFPPSVLAQFQVYFTEWISSVALDDRSVSFESYLTAKGIKNDAHVAMHMALYEIAMRLLSGLGL